MSNNNSYSDLEHLELVARRIAESGADITRDYQDWINVTFACASLGEAAREPYHTICSQYPGYKREECDKCFDNCLRTGRGDIRLGTLIKMAKDHGIDTSLPRGRRPKSDNEKRKEKENLFQQMSEKIAQWYDTRFNTWKNRVEICKRGTNQWAPMTDRDHSTIFARLQGSGLNVKKNDVMSLMESRDYSKDYDVVRTWLDGLPTYHPDTDPDYIADFFGGHLEYADSENADFYQRMLTKWFVGMVALWTGKVNENPIMPVFCGEQHIGKTYFIRHILPPELRQYYKEPSPSDPVDKDFIISLSEVTMIFMDEFYISSDTKSNAYKSVVTSTQSNLRDAYGRFREIRQRKASLIGATNYKQFIRDVEGNRRYLGIDLKGTKDLNQYPLPYEGAYAQALWMIENGFQYKPTHEESEALTLHNSDFMELNDCEEALMVFIRHPADNENGEALSAGELLQELNTRGFRGKGFNVVSIGKAMKKQKFQSITPKGRTKYFVKIIDYDTQKRERKQEGLELDNRPF